MRILLVFGAGFVAGWLVLAYGTRRILLAQHKPTWDGTISSPEGEWTFTGANISHSPWAR